MLMWEIEVKVRQVEQDESDPGGGPLINSSLLLL